MSSACSMQIHSYRGASSRAFASSDGATLWRSSYQKVAPFALVDSVVTDVALTNTSGEKSVTVPRHGDLLANAYVHIEAPTFTYAAASHTAYVKNFGQAMIKKVALRIGNQEVDSYTDVEAVCQEELMGCNRYTGEMDMNYPKEEAYFHPGCMFSGTLDADATVLGATAGGIVSGGLHRLAARSVGALGSKDKVSVYVPLRFWFCESQSSLPLVSLMYHKVSLNFTFRTGVAATFDDYLTFATPNENGSGSQVPAPSASGLAAGTITAEMVYSFVLLGQEERDRMMASTSEMLIVQHQNKGEHTLTGLETGASIPDLTLNFSHPVSMLIWVGHIEADSSRAVVAFPSAADRFDFRGMDIRSAKDGNATTHDAGPYRDVYTKCQLKLNAQNRFNDFQDPQYFRTVQPFQHFGCVPKYNYVYCYAFAQAPGVWNQPSGHINMSRIDSAVLNLTPNETGKSTDKLRSYVMAWNLNVLRFSGGIGGCRYSV